MSGRSVPTGNAAGDSHSHVGERLTPFHPIRGLPTDGHPMPMSMPWAMARAMAGGPGLLIIQA